MKSVLSSIVLVLVISSTGQAGLEFPGKVNLDSYLRVNPNSIDSAEIIDCSETSFQGYLPELEQRVFQRFTNFELRDGLQRNRVSSSFLRKGIKNADCIKITVKGSARDKFNDQIKKATKVIDYVMDQQKRYWRSANRDQLKDQENGRRNIVRIDNPRRRGIYCTGNQFIDFSEKIQLWSIAKTPSRGNVVDLTYVFALEGKGKDYIDINGGYGCRYRGETKSVSDVKLWGNFKDTAPLDPKEDQIEFNMELIIE